MYWTIYMETVKPDSSIVHLLDSLVEDVGEGASDCLPIVIAFFQYYIATMKSGKREPEFLAGVAMVLSQAKKSNTIYLRGMYFSNLFSNKTLRPDGIEMGSSLALGAIYNVIPPKDITSGITVSTYLGTLFVSEMKHSTRSPTACQLNEDVMTAISATSRIQGLNVNEFWTAMFHCYTQGEAKLPETLYSLAVDLKYDPSRLLQLLVMVTLPSYCKPFPSGSLAAGQGKAGELITLVKSTVAAIRSGSVMYVPEIISSPSVHPLLGERLSTNRLHGGFPYTETLLQKDGVTGMSFTEFSKYLQVVDDSSKAELAASK